LVFATIAFVSEFVANRIQQNKRKLERQEPFEEVTVEINDKGSNDNLAERQTTIDIAEVCQEICKDLELAEVDESSNIITTIAEVHSHHNDID